MTIKLKFEVNSIKQIKNGNDYIVKLTISHLSGLDGSGNRIKSNSEFKKKGEEKTSSKLKNINSIEFKCDAKEAYYITSLIKFRKDIEIILLMVMRLISELFF